MPRLIEIMPPLAWMKPNLHNKSSKAIVIVRTKTGKHFHSAFLIVPRTWCIPHSISFLFPIELCCLFYAQILRQINKIKSACASPVVAILTYNCSMSSELSFIGLLCLLIFLCYQKIIVRILLEGCCCCCCLLIQPKWSWLVQL